MRSWRSRWTGVRPGSVRLTSVTTSVGTSHAPDGPQRLDGRLVGEPGMLDAGHAGRRRADGPTRCPGRGSSPGGRAPPAASTMARTSSSSSSGPAVDHPARLVAGRRQHRRLGRDDLDHVRPAVDHRSGWPPAMAAGARRLQPERRPVSVDRPDRRPGRDDPGPRTWPAAIRSRSTTSRFRIEPGTASRRDPGTQGESGVPSGGRQDLAVGPTGDRLERTVGRIERVVGMGIDEPGSSVRPVPSMTWSPTGHADGWDRAPRWRRCDRHRAGRRRPVADGPRPRRSGGRHGCSRHARDGTRPGRGGSAASSTTVCGRAR